MALNTRVELFTQNYNIDISSNLTFLVFRNQRGRYTVHSCE